MRRLLLSLLLASTVLLHDVHGDDLVVSSTNLPSTIEMSTTEDVVTTTEMLSSVATSTELESTTMMSTVEASTTTDATTIELMTDATITTTEEPSSTINMAESTMQTEQMETTTEILSETTTEMTLETTSEMEAVTTTRDPIRKWNRLDLLEEYKKKTVPCNEVIEVPEDEPVGPCPEGWIHYMESCYLILKKYATMDQADEICQSYNTTLFVADHQDELVSFPLCLYEKINFRSSFKIRLLRDTLGSEYSRRMS